MIEGFFSCISLKKDFNRDLWCRCWSHNDPQDEALFDINLLTNHGCLRQSELNINHTIKGARACSRHQDSKSLVDVE